MEHDSRIVARYLDGRVLKGVTRDFAANRPSFHLEVEGTGRREELWCRELKALFFVRSFEGDASRQDLRGFVDGPAETAQGRKIAVRFKDDECICGYTASWSPERDGFFMVPSDAGSNNLRIFVFTASTVQICVGLQAESLAQSVLSESGPARREAAKPPASASAPTTEPRPSGTHTRPTGQFTRPPIPGARRPGAAPGADPARPGETQRKPPESEAA